MCHPAQAHFDRHGAAVDRAAGAPAGAGAVAAEGRQDKVPSPGHIARGQVFGEPGILRASPTEASRPAAQGAGDKTTASAPLRG